MEQMTTRPDFKRCLRDCCTQEQNLTIFITHVEIWKQWEE